MRLIGILYFLSFYGHLDTTLTDVAQGPNAFMKVIRWKRQNNINFNFDVNLNTPEIIKRAGYPSEVHIITTEDGYLLTLFRIPGGNSSPPVLLIHPFTYTSDVWIILGKGKALAYLLADQGYDVWLGNFRGNTYSKAHIFLSPSSSTFWNFSFDEMGIYDLPAMITFITNMRSQPLHTYIGHSIGPTCFFIMAIKRPEIARMVQTVISLAPTVFMSDIKGPQRYLPPIWKEIQIMTQFFFSNGHLRSDLMRILVLYEICDQIYFKRFCVNLIYTILDYDKEQVNHTLLPAILSRFPSSISNKALVHFLQFIQSGKFRQYDYGREKNLLMYNSAEPPDYNLANVNVPIALFYGSNDGWIRLKDMKRLYHSLPNVIDFYEVPNFEHSYFLWSKDAPKLVYERIFMIMKRQILHNVTSVG